MREVVLALLMRLSARGCSPLGTLCCIVTKIQSEDVGNLTAYIDHITFDDTTSVVESVSLRVSKLHILLEIWILLENADWRCMIYRFGASNFALLPRFSIVKFAPRWLWLLGME